MSTEQGAVIRRTYESLLLTCGYVWYGESMSNYMIQTFHSTDYQMHALKYRFWKYVVSQWVWLENTMRAILKCHSWKAKMSIFVTAFVIRFKRWNVICISGMGVTDRILKPYDNCRHIMKEGVVHRPCFVNCWILINYDGLTNLIFYFNNLLNL